MRRTHYAVAVLLLLAGTFAGCVSAREIQRYPARTPTAALSPPRSVAIYRIVSAVPAGTEVGTLQAGVACVGQGRQWWKLTGDLEPAVFSVYATRAREEFRKAGYVVLGEETTSMTGTSLFQPPPAGPMPDFLIAAVIKHVASNTCYPYAGFFNTSTTEGEASMEVEWQVFDPASQRMVLTRTIGGHGILERGDHGPRAPVHEAFAASARNLVAEGEVALLLSTKAPLQASPPPPPPPPPGPPPPK